MLTIAALTLREVVRRRAPIISFLIAALLLVGLFVPLSGRLLLLPRPTANAIVAGVYIMLATDIIKFFASVFAIALASGAIGAELERGVLSAILPKPITRFSAYAGKWLGLVAFVALNVVLWEAMVWAVASVRAPHLSHRAVWTGLPYLLLYPVVFATLALCFSTFSSFPLAAGLSILITGVGWSEAILLLLNRAFDVDLLQTLSRAAGWLMPLGRMSRWVAKGMGPVLRGPAGEAFNVGARGPFKEIIAQPFDLLYIGLYALAIFAVGAVVLGRRDV